MRNILIIGIISLFSSCGSISEDIAQNIQVSKFTDKTFNINEHVNSVRSLKIHLGENVFMADIKDVCMIDSSVFVADNSNALYHINKNNGRVITHARNIGRAKNEYINIDAITSDHKNLFLLDSRTKRILVFDKEMKFVKDIRIDVPALDLVKTNDGFLIYNPIANDRQKRFIHIDNNGKTIGDYIIPEVTTNTLMTTNYFSVNNDGRIFMYEATAYTIYEWKDGNVIPIYTLSFDKDTFTGATNYKQNSLDINEVLTAENFVTSNYILSSFINDNNRFYNLYDTKSKRNKNGMVDTTSQIPFFPRWQSGNTLIGSMTRKIHNTIETTLLFFNL